MKLPSQKGYSLMELSIAAALASLGILAAIQMRATQTQVDAARGIAQVYERLNNAAGSYMTLYYQKLLDKSRPECGKFLYQVGGAVGAPRINSRIDCSIRLVKESGEVVSVANYLQPTPEELSKLGLLSGLQNSTNEHGVLPLPTYVSTGGNDSLIAVNADNTRAPSGFGILIQLMCIGDANVKDPVTEAGVCVGGPFDLRSLVFNLQPYDVGGVGQTLLYHVMDAGGAGKTYFSDTRFEGKLRAGGNVLDNSLDNPMKVKSSTDGAPFILAMRNGYGSAGHTAFVRRDGSTPLTGDWNVGGKDITGLGTLGAANVSTSSLNANTLTSTVGVFGGLIDSFGAAFKTTTAYVKDALTVAGTLSVSGAVSLTGSSTKVSHLRLQNEAEVGDSCNFADETLRRSKTTSGDLLLLVCNPSTGKWAQVQKDYKSTIDSISSAVSTVGNSISVVSSGLATLQDDYMNWDIININWEKATLESENKWLAKDYVWKRTPWKCNGLNGGESGTGGLPQWDKENGIRWAKDASEFQKAVAGAAYTPPIFVGFDDVVNDNIVYDINCEPYAGDNNTKYWYVGVSAKRANERNGNICRSGLGSHLTESDKTMYTYTGVAATCKDFNLLAPNFAPQAIAARFIAFTKKTTTASK